MSSPIEARLRQQAALVSLSRRALRPRPAARLLADACRVASRVLQVDHAHALELLPDGRTLMARAASGWAPDRLAQWYLDVPPDSRLGLSLQSGGLYLATRTAGSSAADGGADLLEAVHMQDGVIVVVEGAGGTRGVFGVYSIARRRFTRDELQFVRSVARIVEAMLDREREASTRRAERCTTAASQAELLRVVVQRLRPALRESVGHLWSFRGSRADSFTFRRAVRETERQVAGVADFIEDLAQLADLLEGRVPARRVVALDPVLASLADQLTPRAASRDVRLELPAAATERAIAGDARLIRRALSNVLDNALRATRGGGVVTLSCTSEPGWTVLEVADTGAGMTPEEVDRLNRVDGAAGDGPRIGWRLASAIVESHGGLLTAASDGREKGSRVTLRFPEIEIAPR